MNGGGGEQRYVSTFRMHIKAPRASSAAGNGPGTVDTRTSDTGKGCMRGGGTSFRPLLVLESAKLFVSVLLSVFE